MEYLFKVSSETFAGRLPSANEDKQIIIAQMIANLWWTRRGSVCNFWYILMKSQDDMFPQNVPYPRINSLTASYLQTFADASIYKS